MRKIKTICVVDDDDISNFVTVEVLEELDLAENIVVCSDGVEAISFLEQAFASKNFPELILLDFNMPGMNGEEFLKVFINKFSQVALNSKIIVLSSFVSDTKLQLLHSLGIFHIITKPLTLSKASHLLTLLN